MKKINYFFSLLIIGLTALNSVQAQTVFSEDFNGGNSFAGWTLVNVDNRVPNTNVAYVNNAWVVREDFDTTGVGDSVAVSTSWYSPAGASDDYMITPMIITTANPVLEYDAKAQDPSFPDGYELRISTTTPTVAGLLANPPLFTTTGENATWTRRSINLSAYANDTIYLGWRNNSNDQFLLLIDNIKVFEPASDDAGITDLVNPTNGRCYYGPDSVFVDIQNFGSDTLNIIPLAFRVNNGPLQTDTFVGSLLPGTSTTFWFQNTAVNLTNPGLYIFEMFTDLVNDGARNNDTLRTFILNTRQAFPYSQNFDSLPTQQTGTFINGWSVQSTGAFVWLTQTGPTTSTATGPTGDHTSGNGVYFYTEASAPAAPNDITALTSPCIDLSSNPAALTMDFWYHMYGADIQTLYIQVENLGVWVNADSIVGQQQLANADPYLRKAVDLTPYVSANSELRVRFITVRGASFNGDIAIDDIRFVIPNPVGIEDETIEFSELNIYPNPTSLGFTTVQFQLSTGSNAQLRVMDMTGKLMIEENLGYRPQGMHQIKLNTANLTEGIYFVNLTIGDEQITRKISVLK